MPSAELRAHLETLGATQVRLLLSNGGLPDALHPGALRWLAEKDQEKATRDREATEKAARIEARRERRADLALWISAAALCVAAISLLRSFTR